MAVLAIYLDAPLQAWGASSKFQYRETNNYPTKSGLVGMIAAAMGVDKHQPDEAEQIQSIAQLKLTLVRLKKNKLVANRLTDFHTVGGGYDKKASIREKMSIPQKASGAPFGTVITHRSYLTDTCFAALFEGDLNLLERIKQALLNPIWGVWFGRKSCLPATPLTPTLGADRQDALNGLLNSLPHMQSHALKDCEHQEEVAVNEDEGGTFYQSDQPVAFGQHHGAIPRSYKARGIVQRRPHI